MHHLVIRQNVGGHCRQNQDDGGPDAPILVERPAIVKPAVFCIVRLIHDGLDSCVGERLALSLTGKTGLRAAYFRLWDQWDQFANPFDNFAPVSYDNASNRSGQKPVLDNGFGLCARPL